MHFKHQITHVDKSKSDKVNFFADIFFFTHLNYGNPGFAELENHKSLLMKINFQLDNYTKHSNQYIKHYFSNPYLSKKDNLIKSFYKKEWGAIEALKSKLFNDFSEVSCREELKTKIHEFIVDLNKSLFKNSIDKIVRAIICDNSLKDHDHIQVFEYYTPLIVSEFIFEGFPKRDLEELFSKILSDDVTLLNDKVSTEAPLPQSLLDIKNNNLDKPDVFYIAVKEYLKNRNLKQQFEGIYFLFKNSLKTKSYLFVISNIKAHKEISFVYNDVLFSNKLRKKYVKRGTTQKAYREFFNGRGKVIAEVSVDENNEKIGKANALLKVQNALNFFNAVLGKEARVKSDDYITKDHDSNTRHTDIVRFIHVEDGKLFKDLNPYEFLSGSRNSLTDKFLVLDNIFFQAKMEKVKETKLVLYWRYLESFFDASDFKNEDLKKAVSKILSKDANHVLAYGYFNLSLQILAAAYYKDPGLTTGKNEILGISSKELSDLLSPNKILDAKFDRFLEIIIHPHVSRRLKEYLKFSEEAKVKITYDYYLKTLTEVYEQRNFVEHSGIHQKESIEKVLLIFPDIVNDFRNLVIDELKKGVHLNFKELIQYLSK